ncbi:MAG: hypothetical protein WCH83_14735 [Alphaproteobacteria bacterium]
MRIMLAAGLVLAGVTLAPAQKADEPPFESSDFRRCIAWMLNGTRGALLQNQCMEHFDLPQPSLFLYASKIRMGFASDRDRKVCAILFEEEVKKIRAGFIR